MPAKKRSLGLPGFEKNPPDKEKAGTSEDILPETSAHSPGRGKKTSFASLPLLRGIGQHRARSARKANSGGWKSVNLFLERGFALAITLTIIIVALILFSTVRIGSSFLGFGPSQNTQATATAKARLSKIQNAATATALASTYPFFPQLVLNDPLINNNNAQMGWQVDSNCTFAGSSYQATDAQENTYSTCSAEQSHYTDFTFQVDAILKQGDTSAGFGLYFRSNDSADKGYLFYIDQSRNYSIIVSVDGTGASARILKAGQATTSQFNSGLLIKNTLAVVARGSQISIYLNQQLLALVSDSTYSLGQIGVVVIGGATKTVAVFNNAKVWAPSGAGNI